MCDRHIKNAFILDLKNILFRMLNFGNLVIISFKSSIFAIHYLLLVEKEISGIYLLSCPKSCFFLSLLRILSNYSKLYIRPIKSFKFLDFRI